MGRVGNEPEPAGLLLQVVWEGSRVNDEPVDLHQPGGRMVVEEVLSAVLGIQG